MLTVALLDVDHFKSYNDRYGHPAGDLALRELGARWTRGVRAIDVLARIGGEEFGLILPGCDATAALAVVERLRGDTPRGLTASAGIATWHDAMTADDLVAAADRELYRAKAEGRDRACVAPARGRSRLTLSRGAAPRSCRAGGADARRPAAARCRAARPSP